MRIVIIGPAFPFRGGIAHFNALLYKHLSKRHSVEVMTFSRQYPKILFPGTSQVESGSGGFAIPAEPIIDSINPLTWLSTARRIKRSQPDLVIFAHWLPFFGLCYGSIMRLLKRKTNLRVLLLCHNIVPHEKRIGDRLFTRFLFRYVDYFIVQSKKVEKDLLFFVPEAKYVLSPHPVYELFGEPVQKNYAKREIGFDDEKIILFFGFVRPYKGLDLLLHAMPRILDRVKLRLLVVGEFYEDIQQYIAILRSNGSEGHVTFISQYVEESRVSFYFSASDIVVLPYRSATQSGIVPIAYQLDKPVIATDVGGLSEVVKQGKTGFIVPPNDSESLAEAVIKFYEDSLEEKFVSNVRVEKEKFSWESFVKGIEDLVGENIDRHS